MLHLSLGENCLSDGILQRHGLKTFNTPYSGTRSNIDYAIQLEREGYAHLLDREALERGWAGPTEVVRNVRMTCEPLFHDFHSQGFEFTHHDVIESESHRESFRRKVERLDMLRGRGNVCFLYHHRVNPRSDLAAIVEKAATFAGFYGHGDTSCRVVVFMQEIVASAAERDVVEAAHADNVRAYVLKSLEVWGGDDQDVFWARKDDDLLARMFQLAKITSSSART
jgi:hypothetical protein